MSEPIPVLRIAPNTRAQELILEIEDAESPALFAQRVAELLGRREAL